MIGRCGLTQAYRADDVAQAEGVEPQWWDAPDECETPEAELDTSGTSPDFCPECLHAPCVAGAKTYCAHKPRFIVAAAMVREIRNAPLPSSPWQLPAVLAAGDLLHVAADRDWRGDSAMGSLAYIRDDIRKSLREQAGESS